MFCRRLKTGLVFLFALLPMQLQAEATTPATVTSHLYLADGPHLRHHTTDATTTLGPDSEQPIEALAADPEQGPEQDPEHGPHGLTDYMLGRTYLYPFMRFATPDVARDGWNLYGYTGGNPVNRVDPDGQFTLVVAASGDTGSLDDPLNQPQLPSLKAVASFVLSLIPGIGDAKDVQEAFSGVDLVTGEELSSGERALTGVAAALPIVGGKMVREGAQAAARGGDEVVDATASVAPTRNIGPKVEKQLGARGWTHDSIDEAVSTGEQIEAVNKATGNPATRFVHPQTVSQL